jgi:hypothetical protein
LVHRVLSISAVSFQHIFNFDDSKTKKQAAIIILSCVLEFGLYLGSLYWIRKASIDYEKVPELVAACKPFADILPGISKTVAAQYTIPSKKTTILWSTLGLPVKVMLSFIIIGVSISIIWLLAKVVKALLSKTLVIIVTSLAFLIGTELCLAQLERKRSILAVIVGSVFEYSIGGFGEVLAVITWLPLLSEAVFGGLRAEIFSSRKQSA